MNREQDRVKGAQSNRLTIARASFGDWRPRKPAARE
jgi:hypothetical protein